MVHTTSRSAVAVLCVAMAATFTAAQDSRTTLGVVTRAASPSNFDFNGLHVFCASSTKVVDPASQYGSYLGCPAGPLSVGQAMLVNGDWNLTQHEIAAAEIDLGPPLPRELTGVAVIDGPPELSAGKSPVLIVRADGYRVRIDSNTSVTFADTLHTLADVKAGNWIEYRGNRDKGYILATSAILRPAAFTSAELNDRGNYEYDAGAAGTKKQNALSQAVKGIDPKRFPAFDNPIMQAHVVEVGTKLIPAYQAALPDGDQAKLNFRFQVVESNVWWDATPLPSGIILVPHELVERMQNDSQLAAVLADSIAALIEKQDYHTQSAARALLPDAVMNAALNAKSSAAQLAGIASDNSENASNRPLNQSSRVSLGLMHDAGYDVNQAPIAWWLLSRKKVAPLDEMPMSHRAAYLYQILGQTWSSVPTTAR